MIARIVSNKKLILLVVFILLFGVAYGLRNPQVLPTSKGSQAVFPDFNKDKIERIEVGQDQMAENILVKKNGRWVVESAGEFPTDESLVENVLTIISKLQKDELVGKNKENHLKYGVDQGNKEDQPRTTSGQGFGGLEVKLSGGGKSFELIVGGRGPGFSSTYFRQAGEDEVYLANQDLDLVFGESEWRDLKLKFKVQSSKFKVISIENENGIYEIAREDDLWILTKPEEKKDIVQSRVEDLLSRLTTLEAADATTSATLNETGFNNPAVTVKVVGESGEDKLVIGNEKDSQRYAQISGSPYIYFLAPSDYGTWEEVDTAYFTEEDSQ